MTHIESMYFKTSYNFLQYFSRQFYDIKVFLIPHVCIYVFLFTIMYSFILSTQLEYFFLHFVNKNICNAKQVDKLS